MEYENDAKIRRDHTNDAALQKLNRRIHDVLAEEEKLAKIMAKLKVVRDIRAQYVASRNHTP